MALPISRRSSRPTSVAYAYSILHRWHSWLVLMLYRVVSQSDVTEVRRVLEKLLDEVHRTTKPM